VQLLLLLTECALNRGSHATLNLKSTELAYEYITSLIGFEPAQLTSDRGSSNDGTRSRHFGRV